MKRSILSLSAILLLASCADDRASSMTNEGGQKGPASNAKQDAATDAHPPTRVSEAADNSARNERDREGGTLTPMDQSENEADLAITQRIRQSVMDDDLLSTMAKNVKIITRGGVVTLRGPVATESERKAIADKAINVAGVMQVDNLLEVAR